MAKTTKKEIKSTPSSFPLVSYIAWVQAIVATASSLYLSEILHWTPCVLCWYQRILMYPLVILIAVGIYKKDKNLPYFVLPMTIIGMGIALFHYLLQIGIVPDAVAPCVSGVSCTTKFFMWLGFITIPFLSLTAFSIITVCMILFLKKQKHL